MKVSTASNLHCAILLTLHFITAHYSFNAVLMDSDATSLIIGIGLTMVHWYEYYSDVKLSRDFKSHTGMRCTLMNGLLSVQASFKAVDNYSVF